MPGHRPDVQDGRAGVSMGADPAMEARVWLKAPVLAAWIYIDIYIHIERERYTYRSEGFAFTGYDIPGCMEDGAWMLRENSSVVVAVVVVAHPDFENGHFSSFITESALPECADRSVSSSDCRRLYVRQKKPYKKIKYQTRVEK